jgi:hypothetical protein
MSPVRITYISSSIQWPSNAFPGEIPSWPLQGSLPHPPKFFTHDSRSYSQLIKPYIISEVETETLIEVTIYQNQFGMAIRYVLDLVRHNHSSERSVTDALSFNEARNLWLSCGTLRFHIWGSYWVMAGWSLHLEWRKCHYSSEKIESWRHICSLLLASLADNRHGSKLCPSPEGRKLKCRSFESVELVVKVRLVAFAVASLTH